MYLWKWFVGVWDSNQLTTKVNGQMETFLLYIGLVLFSLLGIGVVMFAVGASHAAKLRKKLRKKHGYNWSNMRPGMLADRGWTNIRICRSCGARGSQFEHMFCSDPCKFCARKDSAETVGRWNSNLQLWETPDEVKLRQETEASPSQED